MDKQKTKLTHKTDTLLPAFTRLSFYTDDQSQFTEATLSFSYSPKLSSLGQLPVYLVK